MRVERDRVGLGEAVEERALVRGARGERAVSAVNVEPEIVLARGARHFPERVNRARRDRARARHDAEGPEAPRLVRLDPLAERAHVQAEPLVCWDEAHVLAP